MKENLIFHNIRLKIVNAPGKFNGNNPMRSSEFELYEDVPLT